jgi:hypothetical protein
VALFDLGGAIALAGIVIAFFASVVHTAGALARAERIPR